MFLSQIGVDIIIAIYMPQLLMLSFCASNFYLGSIIVSENAVAFSI